ncbi:MAG: DNA-processing protein DprA [Alphaproteobacteria bacterium]
MKTFVKHNSDYNSDEQERLDWLRLIRTENIGPITFYQLLGHFGSAREALYALPELSKKGGRKKPLSPPGEKQIAAEYKALQKRGGHLVTAQDPSYSLALSSLDDAPPVLSVIGNPDFLNRPALAIVGARNASLNGRKFARNLASDLGKRGQVIVSGLARGIDTAAHEGSLGSGTVAVVAGGVDVVYPEENQKLYDEITEKGAVIAESAFGAKPFAAAFPKRNRIVAGLSSATIVVEAGLRSGSLITARLAGEMGRDVMAVPGSPLDPRAKGPNHLIREGAVLVRDADDVLEIVSNFLGDGMREHRQAPTLFDFDTQQNKGPEQQNSHPKSERKTGESEAENILACLSFTPIHIDELVRACHLTIPELQLILIELELAGRVARHAGNKIALLKQYDE